MPRIMLSDLQSCLRPHQKDALKKMHNGCILKGGVGSGKTWVALVYYLLHEEGKDLYVITTARKRDELDWETIAASFGIGRKESVDNKGVITVDSWSKIKEYINVRNALFVFDEQRLVGSGVWVESFLKIARHNSWIMLSATPGDSWIEYLPIFIANGYFRNRTEFIQRHVVYSRFTKYPKIDRYVGTAVLEKIRKEIVVDMPYDRHTIRHVETLFSEFNIDDLNRLRKDRWNIFLDKPLRDAGELFRLSRKSVNIDDSRMKLLYDVFERHKKVIVFYNFDYELELLRHFCEDKGIAFKEWNGHNHESLPYGDSWIYLCQYTAASEAWNCTTTDCLVLFSLNYSYKLTEQAMGRIDRMDTPFDNLYYYFIRSKSWIDDLIWKSVGNKENFSEGKYAKLYFN